MRMRLFTVILLSFVFSNLMANENDSNHFYKESIVSDLENKFFGLRPMRIQDPSHQPQLTEHALIFTFFGNNEDSDPSVIGTFTAMVTLPNQQVHSVKVPFDGSASISIPAPSQAGLYGIAIYADPEFSGVTNTQTVTVSRNRDIGLLYHFNSLCIPQMMQTTIYINKP